MKKNMMLSLPLIFLLLITLSSCYRMPEDDEYSLIPTTNNPDVIRDSGSQWMPNVGGF